MGDGIKDLAARHLSSVLELLGLGPEALAAMGLPAEALGAASAITAARLLTTHFERAREGRREERAQRLVEDLSRRLRDVEPRKLDEPEVNLFAEMFLRVVADDDARKTPFQGAFIAWMARAKRAPTETRLLGDAICRLTFEELQAFVKWGRNTGGFNAEIYLRGSPITGDVFLHRLDSTGLLIQGGPRGRQFFSAIGKALVEECRGEPLDQGTP